MKNQYQMLSDNESRLLLNDKVTTIFGAGGAIGSQIAREFSREGATIFLSGRRLDSVEKVAKEIRPSIGKADAREVNALDEKAVNDYLDYVIEQAGRIDIVFNAIGPQPIEFDNGKYIL
jgi:3-oxoacyl-[acyl-carrier protein] reductase